jgi:hypothetical protein
MEHRTDGCRLGRKGRWGEAEPAAASIPRRGQTRERGSGVGGGVGGMTSAISVFSVNIQISSSESTPVTTLA